MSNWTRPHWEPGGGDAYVFYAVFGQPPAAFDIDVLRYRTTGLPDGVKILRFTRHKNNEYIQGLCEGHSWQELVANDPVLAARIESAPGCLVVAGTVNDPPSLSYLRDVIGFTTFLLDSSGVAVLDLQTFWWFDATRWRNAIFEQEEFRADGHVVILVSPEEAGSGAWFHTRGMRKFGRPDLSVHGVDPGERQVMAEFINGIIETQALGTLLLEGQTIASGELEWRGVVHLRGDLDDPDFNNVHVEIERYYGAIPPPPLRSVSRLWRRLRGQ